MDVKPNFKWYEKVLLYPILIPFFAVKDFVSKIENDSFRTRLHQVVIGKGNEEKIKSILKSGANPNAKDRDGRTALHLAALNHRFEYIPLLVSLGVDPRQKDDEKATVLHYMSEVKDSEILNSVLTSAINLNDKTDLTEQTVLHLFVKNGDPKMVKILLAKGAKQSIDVKDYLGNTALHYSMSSMHPQKLEVTKLLIAAGANTLSQNRKSQTAYDLGLELQKDPLIDQNILKQQLRLF
ncbi:hypothetical protein LPTSP4_17000 [Leptospira ryugenii]|uniref:Uncharacterized protein n=2 Tax=Leptospira ryugenii TaxID=1917863 RepID=A0A2P2E024_9LEPT|nr:hypothetical protein LPTSP4_17000 [Leptospira ryugenii]